MTTYLLRELMPGQDYLMQFRSNNGDVVSAWSPVYQIRTIGDVTAPQNPRNLSWQATGESFVAAWDAPLFDGNGKALKDFKNYEVTLYAPASNKTKVFTTVDETFELSLVRNAQTFGFIELEIKITVKSVDNSGNKSAGVSLTAVEDTPPIPSTPIVSVFMGQLQVTWDGTTSLGTINPFNLNYVEIHASPTSNFTPSPQTMVGKFIASLAGVQKTIIPGVPYGQLTYVKLVSINRKGKASPPSNQASATPTRITGLEIDPNAGLNASQMNFTARQLGGANAFYSDTLLTGSSSGGTTFKEGDVLYITAAPPADNAGKTYRRSSSNTWVEDTKIGVIAGTKLLANTVTADAIGTNKIITTSANIGDAVIDSAKISYIDASIITAGVLQSRVNVNYGGILQPAWMLDLAGNATLNNVTVNGVVTVGNISNSTTQNQAFGIKSYNYAAGAAGWAINGDGTVEFGSATLRGSFRTATTGRRVEIGAADTAGRINFFAPSGANGFILSYTEAQTNPTEAIQFGMQVPGYSGYLWNRINYNQSPKGEYAAYRSGTHEFTFATSGINTNGGFFIYGNTGERDGVGTQKIRFSITDKSFTYSSATNPRLYIDEARFSYKDLNGFVRVEIDDWTSFFGSEQTNQPVLEMRQGDGYLLHKGNVALAYQEFNADGSVYFRMGDQNASILMRPTGQNSWYMPKGSGWLEMAPLGGPRSPILRFFSDDGYGAGLQGIHDSRGIWLEVADWASQNLYGIRAANFEVGSDERMKNSISKASVETFREKIVSTPVKKYKRNKNKQDRTRDTFEIGLIAQEAPSEIVLGNEKDGLGIDVYQMCAMLWGAVQEMHVELESLKKNSEQDKDKE